MQTLTTSVRKYHQQQ